MIGITYEAYSPLGGPDLHGKSVMSYPEIVSIAKVHTVSGAQVAMRWVVQQGVAVVTATGATFPTQYQYYSMQIILVTHFHAVSLWAAGNKEYMAEDMAVLGFELSEAEMSRLSAVTGAPP